MIKMKFHFAHCIRFIVLIGDRYKDRYQGQLSTAIFPILPHLISFIPEILNHLFSCTLFSYIVSSLSLSSLSILYHIIIICLPFIHAGNTHINGNSVLHISKLHRSSSVVVIENCKFVIFVSLSLSNDINEFCPLI